MSCKSEEMGSKLRKVKETIYLFVADLTFVLVVIAEVTNKVLFWPTLWFEASAWIALVVPFALLALATSGKS